MRAPGSHKMQGCTPPAAADTPASACTNDDVSPMPEFFRAPEGARTESLVRQDMERVEALHAPEYQLITPSSMEFTRERYVRAIPARLFYAEWDIDSMTVRISPGMGIVCYRVRLQVPSGRVVSGWHPDSDDEGGPLASGLVAGHRTAADVISQEPSKGALFGRKGHDAAIHASNHAMLPDRRELRRGWWEGAGFACCGEGKKRVRPPAINIKLHT